MKINCEPVFFALRARGDAFREFGYDVQIASSALRSIEDTVNLEYILGTEYEREALRVRIYETVYRELTRAANHIAVSVAARIVGLDS